MTSIPNLSHLGKSRASATSTSPSTAPTFGIMWRIMRSIGDISLPFFFSSLDVSNPHLVPSSSTPLIVCSNHSNTILDVAILASHFPDRRGLHFWAKAGFFKNPITSFILTSSGNIKVDRTNKNNQELFEGTFEAMKQGGAIALFPEGGSYTIPKLAKLKMGAAWAALEYSRYLQLQEVEEGGMTRTEVRILPTAVMFDDKSVFRSRAVLRFGKPLKLDAYIDEFLSSPLPISTSQDAKGKVVKQDGTVPARPESMTRSNTNTSTSSPSAGVEEVYASPSHRAVSRLTADLQRAIEDLTFNAPNWESYQAVRLARELTFELTPPIHGDKHLKEPMEEYVELSRAFLTLLTIPHSRKSRDARRKLFVYSSLLHLSNTDNTTLARLLRRGTSPFSSALKSFLLRLPVYVPVFAPTLIPTYILPNALAHHFAGREEESLSSVKTLFGFFLTSMLYATLLVKTMQWTKWSPPGLLVGLAGVWWLHDLNRSNIDTAYSLVKQMRLGWSARRTNLSFNSTNSDGRGGKGKEGKSLFFYGTLVHPSILARVIGNTGNHLRVQNAVLDGAKLYHVRDAEYPGLLRDPESCVKGTLVSGLTEQDIRCLDAFEGEEYTRTLTTVIPDPTAPVETNSDRILNAGTSCFHTILSGLTKERMSELFKSNTSSVVEGVEVYNWTASKSRLDLDRIWEFDIFARDYAKNWIGEGQGEVENEYEYQLVDSIRVDSTWTLTTTLTPTTSLTTTTEDENWIETHASTLASNNKDVQEAVVKVCTQLQEKPSIQFYVNKAFPRQEGLRRPNLDNPQLIQALVRARKIAQDALEELLGAVEAEGDEGIKEALTVLAEAKGRVLRRKGVQVSEEGASWPFTMAQLQGYAAVGNESRKNV